MKRELPTDQHREKYKDFEKIMMYRTAFFHALWLTLAIYMAVALQNNLHVDKSRRYVDSLEDDTKVYRRRADAIRPYVSAVSKSLMFGRVIFLLTLRCYPQLLKASLVHSMLLKLTGDLMPIDYGQVYDFVNMNDFLIVYAATAFDLYGSVFSLAIYKLVYHFGIGIILHPRGLSVWQHGFSFFIDMTQQTFYISMMHIIFSWLGILYVESALPRVGYEKVFEGSFILALCSSF